MAYIQSIAVRGVGGGKELKAEFSPFTNLVYGSDEAASSSFLLLLFSALSGNAFCLRNLEFDTAEVAIVHGENEGVHLYKIEKKDISSGEAVSNGKDYIPAWGIEPAPPDMEAPVIPHLYLPSSSDYTNRRARAHPLPTEGGLPGKGIESTLQSLGRNCCLDLSMRMIGR